MLSRSPWMQRSTQASLRIQGKTPKTKVGMYTLPQGWFSETLNYNEPPKIRPELFSSRTLFDVAHVKTFNYSL
jgi:hypothetical protein